MIENYSFELLNKNNLKEILLLRNQKKVRASSFKTKIIQEKEHLEWFNNKIKNPFFHHYVLTHNEKTIGLGYGEKSSEEKKSCMWGLYLNLSIKSEIKYGSVIAYLLFEKLFNDTNVNQIKCQVKIKKDFERMKDWQIDWHIRWGHEYSNFDKQLNCDIFVLKKEIWRNIKHRIYEKGFKKN